jgi:nitric oxide reductase subunit B
MSTQEHKAPVGLEGGDASSETKSKTASLAFIGTGLVALLVTLIVGFIVAIQYSFPDWFEAIPFHKTRPIHVSLALTWIFFTAVGGIYYYLQSDSNVKLWKPRLSWIHFGILLAVEMLILFAYLSGMFGGREYLEYPSILSIPLFLGWIMFAVVLIKSLPSPLSKLPVYYWMWAAGVLVFLYAFAEAHLWLIPFFGENVVRDITVQWKSLGSLVASWNMFIYGTAICLMYRINQDKTVLRGGKTFFLFFLGLTNSFFNWGHHTYIVPAAPWVAYIAYGVSMTELLILYFIIRGWLKGMRAEKKIDHVMPQRFMFAAETWILLNLILAIAISIPAINLYTHGTHITVAHSMGSTIGINTMILLASVFFICSKVRSAMPHLSIRFANWGYYLTNIALLVFLGCLVAAGSIRGYLISTGEIANFQLVQNATYPYMLALIASGLGLLVGLLLIIVPLLAVIVKPRRSSST